MKKKVLQGGDIDVLVSDTLGTQESRIDPETDLYLVHPSGILLIICGSHQKCRYHCYSYFAVVLGVGVAVVVFIVVFVVVVDDINDKLLWRFHQVVSTRKMVKKCYGLF